MEQEKTGENYAEAFFADWMKSAMNFWGEMAKTQPDFPGGFGMDFTPRSTKSAEQARKMWETGGKIFQSLFSTASRPDSVEEALKGIDAVPDLIMTMARQSWDGYYELQKQWMDRAAKFNYQTKAYNFEDIDQETFKAVRDLYEREFQKFLKVPSLGLTRFYQDKFNNTIDKYNIFVTAISEFIYMFYVPIEKTGVVMQEKLEEMAEQGQFFDDFKDYYNMWIKILEGHYMTLLQSPEYTDVMDKTIQALVHYREAKEELVSDILRNLPVPTNREMDELYKDLYVLKKKVRDLSKKVEGNGNLAAETK